MADFAQLSYYHQRQNISSYSRCRPVQAPESTRRESRSLPNSPPVVGNPKHASIRQRVQKQMLQYNGRFNGATSKGP